MKDLQNNLKTLRKTASKQKELLINSIPPLLLIFILVFLVYKNLMLREQIIKEPRPSFVFRIKVQPYPIVQRQFVPVITAQAAIIMDDASKVVIYEKNPSFRFSMASTTKIMTALVALDHYPTDAVLTVYRDNVEGTVVGFQRGEQIRVEDMLYALMLPSGNDAAYALADNYPGGVPAFVQRMNEKATMLGLSHTHYADPAGLEDDEDYTIVSDLANLTSYAITNKAFTTIVGTKRKTITTIDATKVYELENLNKFLGENGVTGVKTGFTEGAGGVLVTSKVEKGRTFIIVVMKSEDRFADTQTLLSFITNNINFVSPIWYPTTNLLEQ